ncbi:MAG: beta-L-arabinofuranosidase domain-containing protein [bacterium]
MMRQVLISLAVLAGVAGALESDGVRLTPVPIQKVVIDDAFWAPKIKTWSEMTIPDCLAKFEKDGAWLNFEHIRDGNLTEPHKGPPWEDGLVYEMIRACADFLVARRDPALEQRVDGYIDRIVAAQAKDPDGYLNTYTQQKEPTHRWGLNGGNDAYQHDVYNAGALVEAGVHYYRATGKTVLLKAAARIANHMCDVMGPPPKQNIIPGHSLPEECLVRLYELFRDQPELKREMGFAVDEQRYLKLSEWFIEGRGNYAGRRSSKEYCQDHKPVFEQETIEGHAVRATLMGTGLAALALANGREEYRAAALRLWENMTGRRMYLTGGVGSRPSDEAFAADYDLPNSGYLETCATVGLAFYSRNLNLLAGDARFVDELERSLYNGSLSGTSLKGDRYSYNNPLEGKKDRARWEWHGCPCCPPMFLKLMGALPGYIYATDSSGLYVNLFIGSRMEVRLGGNNVKVRQSTGYPWDGAVKLAVELDKPATFDLYVRIPAWCQGASSSNDLYRLAGRPASGAARLKVNGQPVASLAMERGYARLSRTWASGDEVELALEMPVRRVTAHPRVAAAADRVAFMRGPIVYAFEGCDNGGKALNLVGVSGGAFTPVNRSDLFGGVTVLRGQAVGLHRTLDDTVVQKPLAATAIPFFANANRELTELLVWLPEKNELAQPALEPSIAERARPSASYACPGDSAHALNDRVKPAASDDTKIPRFTWWDHRGTKEWVQYDFGQEQTLSSVAVYWWDERRIKHHCRVPQSWQVLYKDGDAWKPVAGASEYGTKMDQFNRVTFTPVKMSALRIEAQLQAAWSGGILEWEVQ